MDARKKRGLLSQLNGKLVKARLVELCINQFKTKIREGPYFICSGGAVASWLVRSTPDWVGWI